MDLHNELMTDFDLFGDNYENDLLLQGIKNRFELQKESLEGFDAKLNDSNNIVRIVMTNHTNSLTKTTEDKYVYVDSNVNLECGSLLKVNIDNVWTPFIVTTPVIDNKVYKSANMIKFTNTLNIIKNSISLPVPCIVSNNSRIETTEGTKFFPLVDGKIEVTVPNSEISHSIAINQVYQIGRNKYKVYHINDTAKMGLLILSMELTSDDIKIPDPLPTSDLIITGDDTIIIDDSNIYKSNISCDWTVLNEDGSEIDYVTIVSQTDSELVLYANDYVGKNIIITAKSIIDETVITSRTVQIVGLF